MFFSSRSKVLKPFFSENETSNVRVCVRMCAYVRMFAYYCCKKQRLRNSDAFHGKRKRLNSTKEKERTLYKR